MATEEYNLPRESPSIAGLKRTMQEAMPTAQSAGAKFEELSRSVSEIAAIIKAAHEAPEDDPLKQMQGKLDQLLEQNKLLVQVLTELTTILKAPRPGHHSEPAVPRRVAGLHYQRTR